VGLNYTTVISSKKTSSPVQTQALWKDRRN